jgi:hypothetical protein
MAGLRAYERTSEDQQKAVCSAMCIKEATFMSNSSSSSSNGTMCQVIQAFNPIDKTPASTPPSLTGTFNGCTFNFNNN